jgi:hypothetical protein
MPRQKAQMSLYWKPIMTRIAISLFGLMLQGLTAANAAAQTPWPQTQLPQMPWPQAPMQQIPWLQIQPLQPPSPPEPPMKVRIGESTTTGCQPDCQAWISAQGKIVAGQTLRQFQAVMRQLKGRKLPVFINSSGGDVAEALAIGRLIRAKGLDTAVIKIDSPSCPAGDSDCAKKQAKGMDNGNPSPYAICASACAFVLAGGTQRYAGPLTQVGVHQPQSFTTYVRLRRVYRVTVSPYGRKTKTLISESKIGQNTVRTETNERQYREMREYLVAMGIGPEAETLMRSAPYYSMHWMTRDELLSTRFITSRSTGLELLPSAATPATALASPPAIAVETPANSAAFGTVKTPGDNQQASTGTPDNVPTSVHQDDSSKEACEKWSGQECKMYGGRWLAPIQYGGRPKPLNPKLDYPNVSAISCPAMA